MRLIRPYYEIFNESDLIRATKEIELAARTCYKSENKIDEGTDIELVTKLLSSGHEAMLEFGPSITVKFVCDRGVSHELVRHRLCSFAQESTRYCNYSKDKFDGQITFIIPSWLVLKEGVYLMLEDNGVFDSPDGILPFHSLGSTLFYLAALSEAEVRYFELINSGWQPQQARSVLPNSLKTEIVVKANIREWRHIFKLRTFKKAHPQMRELMIPLLQNFQSTCPTLFNDIKIE